MKRNMRQHLFGAVAVATLLVGCNVKDPIYNTPHPEEGTIALTTDWSGIGKGLSAPANFTVKVGDFTATLTGTNQLIDRLFDPAVYPISVYNTPEQIAIAGTTATVSEASGNVDGVGKFVSNAPGWLFTSTGELSVEADKDHAYTAVMEQQVRELTLLIEPTGGTTDRIERIEGYLSGAAASLNFSEDAHATPSNIELHFARIAEGDNAGRWSATVRLLGVAGAQQKLNAQLHFTDGSPQVVNLDSDLTNVLATFNADKRTPLTLGGSVVETPTETGFTATIIDWQPVSGSGTAN